MAERWSSPEGAGAGAGWLVSAWLAAAALAAVTLAALVLKRSSWWKAVCTARSLTGPKTIPFLGNVLTITNHQELIDLGRTSYERFGGVFRVWMTVVPMFVVLEPAYIQTILSSHKHTNKISLYRLLHNFLGEGLITSSGEEWRTHRKLIQPSFHINVLEGFVPTYYKCAKAFVKTVPTTGPEGINISSYINMCVLNILSEAVLGIPAAEKKTEQNDSPFRKGKVVVPYRLVRPWLLLTWVYQLTENAKKEIEHKNSLVDFTRKILDARRKAMKEDNKSEKDTEKKSCLLDFLISVSEKNETFTDDDIVNEVCTFMLAGQDSVGGALAFAVLMLAKHQEIQNKVIAELNEIFVGECRVPTRQDLASMRYLEQCLKETLRLYPSVPMIARKLGDDISIGKHTLPKGSEVLISPFAVHRIKNIFSDPEIFDPSRFDQGNIEGRNPYSYLPFSAGPRNCIGFKFSMMEMKTILAVLLQQYRLDPVPGKDYTDLKYRLTLRNKGGVWVRLTPRTQQKQFSQK